MINKCVVVKISMIATDIDTGRKMIFLKSSQLPLQLTEQIFYYSS